MGTFCNVKIPKFSLTGDIVENFKTFEVRFDDYCIQAGYRNLDKDPGKEPLEYFIKPILEVAALRTAMPDEALKIIRYEIDPQISSEDKKKPWVWMEKLSEHFTKPIKSSLMTDRYAFWNLSQKKHESIQNWELRVRQTGNLCRYGNIADELFRDKFVFGLYDNIIRIELLRTHQKPNNITKTLSDVVMEAKTMKGSQANSHSIVDMLNDADAHLDSISSLNSLSSKETTLSLPAKLKRGKQNTYHHKGTCKKCFSKQKPCMCRSQSITSKYSNEHINLQYHDEYDDSYKSTNFDKYDKLNKDKSSTRLDKSEAYYNENFDYIHDPSYSIETNNKSKENLNKLSGDKYFVTLQVSSCGSAYQPVRFQINTSALCNTIAESVVKQAFPDSHIFKSVYLLCPYGNTKLIRSMGQIDLNCQWENIRKTLTFHVLSDEVMDSKPNLLSYKDCDKMGLTRLSEEAEMTKYKITGVTIEYK